MIAPRILAAALFTSALGACAAQSPEVLGERAPIVYGTVDTAAAHEAVVRLDLLWANGEHHYCSGTLIAPRLVLTAGHCLDEDISQVRVGFGVDVNAPSARWFTSTGFDLHPDYASPTSFGQAVNDVALVHLAEAPEGVTPIPTLPRELALTADDIDVVDLELVGYGRTESDTYGERRAVTRPFAYACFNPRGCLWRWGTLGLSSPAGGNICHRKDPGGTCRGDSGGPAFIVHEGVQYVAGVTSWSDRNCENVGCAASVDTYEAFFAEHVGTGNGTACDTDETCATGYCVDGVCCASACDDVCDSCGLEGHLGVCEPVTCDDATCDGSSYCMDGACVCDEEAEADASVVDPAAPCMGPECAAGGGAETGADGGAGADSAMGTGAGTGAPGATSGGCAAGGAGRLGEAPMAALLLGLFAIRRRFRGGR